MDGVFGDGMMENVPVVSPGTSVNASILALISCGLRCKGYDGTPVGGFGFGQYDSRDQNAVSTLRSDASYPHGGSNSVSPQIWKGLCRVDAYVLVPSGDAKIRHIQQRINEQYGNEANIGLNPTDGIASAAVTRGSIGGLQVELNQLDDENDIVVDWVWGASTAGPVPPVGTNASAPGGFNEIAQWGLYLNGFDVPLDRNFTTVSRAAADEFKDFMCINPPASVGGQVDTRTWAALMVSYGDTSRGQWDISAGAAIGMDTSTKLDGVMGTFVDANYPAGTFGFTLVGRYLMNTPGGSLNKELSAREIEDIHGVGLGIVPIFQTYGGESSYFTDAQGREDAADAQRVCDGFGVPNDVVVYFAVDFDAYGTDIEDNVLPYFRGVNAVFQSRPIGVYGARRVCTDVSAAGLSVASYVGNLSSGWSGNIGQAMPTDWAYDQYDEFNVAMYDDEGNHVMTEAIDQLVVSNRYGRVWWGTSSVS